VCEREKERKKKKKKFSSICSLLNLHRMCVRKRKKERKIFKNLQYLLATESTLYLFEREKERKIDNK